MNIEQPKYCKTCGSKLKYRNDSRVFFDEKSGKRLQWQILDCPERKWFQILHPVPGEYHFDEMGPVKEHYYRTVEV